MHRGVRRKAIFQEEMDYQVLLQVLKNSLEKYKCILHAYCLMTNHIHLLLETGDMEVYEIYVRMLCHVPESQVFLQGSCI